MSNCVGIHPFSNPLWVAMESMDFHIAHTNILGQLRSQLRLGVHNEQFGTHEKLSWGLKVT